VTGLAAIVLAGGAATRLGGRDKPGLPVGGVPMIGRVLGAVAGARPRVVVGPARDGLPDDVLVVREEPAGGGPVAAVAAGLQRITGPVGGSAEVPPGVSLVALLAADLPFLTAAAVDALVAAVESTAVIGAAPPTGPAAAVESTVDGALYVDGQGRRQLLCGVWRLGALRRALAALGDPAGRSMRSLLAGLRVTEVRAEAGARPPWYDCDTDEDLRKAEQ
jgi:molybdopterin-guanine dinucleotide biosynthesis protein A